MNPQFINDVIESVIEKLAANIFQLDPHATETQYTKGAVGGAPTITPVPAQPGNITKTWLQKMQKHQVGTPGRKAMHQRAMQAARNEGLLPEQMQELLKGFQQ